MWGVCGEAQAEDAAEYLNFLSGLPPLRAVPRPWQRPLLAPKREQDRAKKTLVLDLDHTLIHSTVFGPQRTVKVRAPPWMHAHAR